MRGKHNAVFTVPLWSLGERRGRLAALIDLDHAVIVDVEASTAIRQAEVTAARTMIERTEERFALHPERLAADSAYGSRDAELAR